MTSPYDTDLGKNAANYQPLTPLIFLERAASTFPDHPAIIHGERRYSYAEFYARSRRLASALAASGIGKDDTVSVMLANTPAMLGPYGAPMTGAVLHSINTRLDPQSSHSCSITPTLLLVSTPVCAALGGRSR
jgi:fatty-acyl-CoA synthase